MSSLELSEVCTPLCLSVLACTKSCKSGACSLARPSNRVCGVAAGACEREERPSASWPKLYPSEGGEEHPGGASGDPLARGEVPWPSTELLDRGVYALARAFP